MTWWSASGESIHPDHLGTPREITDDAGKTVWQWSGEAFGASAPNEDPNATGSKFTFNLRFAGQYADSETGLSQNGYRDYDPQSGRYIESDPLGLGGGSLSLYGYTGDNPLSHTDPFGLRSLDDWTPGKTVPGYTPVPLPVPACIPPVCGLVPAPGAFPTLPPFTLPSLPPGTGTLTKLLFECAAYPLGCAYVIFSKPSPDQQALGEVVKDVTRGGRKPLSDSDADTILDWGREYGVGVRDDRGTDHWVGGSHIHVPGSGVGHVPVKSVPAKCP